MSDNLDIISEALNMDCMEYMRTLPDKCMDLVIADPPYGIDIGNGLGSGKKSCKMHHDWQFKAPSQEMLDEMFRVSKEQIIWGGNYFDLPICDNWIIWDKLNPNLSFAEAELAWCSIHRKIRIFKHYSARVDGGTKIHPTQKPVELYAWIFQNYLNGKSRIFDPMMGSQSSRIAAYKLGIEYHGCEIDPEYYTKGCERFDKECLGIHTINNKRIKQLDIF